ncbi:SIMPL domain-containing protein [Sphingomonas sp.]|uniref:SIMPL domain-containing protein n=1 Tax=Sphingomonas sp. TaxID=28214 RepID=UPI00286CD9DA|nr:SIMPL domain-containing protein [Sphingomonas sp.]
MKRLFAVPALLAGTMLLPTAAVAQPAPAAIQSLAGTRLDISATGEVSRVPDIATISAGVTTQAVSASDAIGQNGARMEKVRAALKRAGVADRDIQTATLNLSPQYKYGDNQPPLLTGYQASNQLSVRFRDIRTSGKIIDALVAQGANQINGPSLSLDKPEEALDEARARAIATGRARADLYARSLGMRVVRAISVSESGGYAPPPPRPMVMMAKAESADASTSVDPGEQQVQITVAMSFELQ